MYLEFILNYIFAWLAVVAGVFLLSKYLLRKSVQRAQGEKQQNLAKVSKSWKWPHIIIGFVLIGLGFIHGLYSSSEVLSINFGTVNWLVAIMLGFTWLFKSFLRARWLQAHGILSILFMVTIVIHVVEVDGINVFRILGEMNDQTVYEATFEDIIPPQATETSEPNEKINQNEADKSDKAELPYYFSFEGIEISDGTYLAEAVGYSPGLKVEVVIENNLVKRIRILKHHEVDSRYWKEAMEVIPKAIIAQQTLDVDAITGSSLTSVGIIKAVRKAVLEAMEAS